MIIRKRSKSSLQDKSVINPWNRRELQQNTESIESNDWRADKKLIPMSRHLRNDWGTDLSIFNKLYKSIPTFDELFDEQTFYLFAFCLTLFTILLAVIVSRFVKLNEVNY